MITRTGIINDLHAPFHDPKSVDLCLNIFEDQEVDRICLNGDILDFYNVNSHGPKDPAIQKTLEDEITWGIEFFDYLRKRFPDTDLVAIWGNHEWRLERFIIDKCPSFFNMFQLHKMCRLEELGYTFIEYNERYQLESTDLYIQHSPPSYGENAAMTSLKKKFDQSHVYGCTHRIQHATKTGSSGRVYNTWLNGWLGSTELTEEHKRVFRYTKNHENWQQGGMIVTCVNEIEYYVEQFQIINHTAVVSGVYYEV